MHEQAMDWVRKFATDEAVDILDIGGRDINGTPRHLFPKARYTVLDLYSAANVAIVADASEWEPTRSFDIVLSTEVFEHTPAWPKICETAFKALRPGGMFVATMAGPGRGPHSGIDGDALHPDEHYQNIDPEWLDTVLSSSGFTEIKIDQLGFDVRCVAYKGG